MSDSHTDSRRAGSRSGHATTTHQDFHWIEGSARHTPYADFLERTLDITAGLHACQQIVYTSELERAANADADPDQMAAVAVGIVETDQIKRFCIAATRLCGRKPGGGLRSSMNMWRLRRKGADLST